MRALFVLLTVLILSSVALGQSLASESFTVTILDNQKATVAEHYYFSFFNQFEKDDFLQTVQNNGRDLLAWQAFDSNITFHFGTQSTVSNASFEFDSAHDALVLKYNTDFEVMQKVAEDPRTETWQVLNSLYKIYDKGSVIVIPTSTPLEIIVPASASITQTPEKAEVRGNLISLSGISQTQLIIQYTLSKPLAPAPNTAQLLQDFFNNRFNLVIVAILILLLAGIAWKRKDVEKKVENFVVAHSEILPKEETKIDIEA
ncbi:MAG: hypothetical protein V1847_01920 [Candidatus Diapherotrites archaeon]